MDHRWDESTLQDRAARAEQARLGTSRIERDLDVERRDQLCLADRLRLVNRSPWEIGTAWHDQRDTYTRNADIDAPGYGCGPSIHPEEGSYAYPRPFYLSENEVLASHATLYEKEAWPWLVYKDPEADPYFAHLHAHEHESRERESIWHRVKSYFANVLVLHLRRRTPEERRVDERITADVSDALTYRSRLDATDIEVGCKRGGVTLEGTVSDPESKRMAADAARTVRGVRDVKNRLKIRRDDIGVDGGLVVSAAM